MATIPGGGSAKLLAGADALDARSSASAVVREFVGALKRSQTYSPTTNAHFLFGLAWGLGLPLALAVSWAWTHEAGTALRELVEHPTELVLVFVVPPTVLSIVFGALGTIRRDQQLRLAQNLRQYDAQVAARLDEQAQAYTATVRALAQAIEANEPYSRGHSFRVWQFAERAATHLGVRDEALQTLEHACFLQDVGKIRIPERILNTPGPLTREEAGLVNLHPVYSERFVAPIVQLQEVAFLVRHHHEREDGAGYPDGLKGEAQPLLLKVLIVADALDAMMSDRPYRWGLPLEAALEELKRCAGLPFDAALLPRGRGSAQQFDPLVVRAMVDALARRPVTEVALEAPSREDLRIADYLVRAKEAPPSSPVPPQVSATRQNCWEVMACERGPGGRRVDVLGACPAATTVTAHGLNGGHHAGRICWAVAATSCIASPRHARRGQRHCSACPFFLKVQSEEGAAAMQVMTPRPCSG